MRGTAVPGDRPAHHWRVCARVCDRDKMYLLRKGAVAVIKDDAVSHTLTRGAFFGEITLLFPAVRRTASVKALTECEMASLTKADLMKVAENYPDFLDMMSTVAKSHLKKDEHEQQRVAMDRSAKQQPAPKATPQQLQQRGTCARLCQCP